LPSCRPRGELVLDGPSKAEDAPVRPPGGGELTYGNQKVGTLPRQGASHLRKAQVVADSRPTLPHFVFMGEIRRRLRSAASPGRRDGSWAGTGCLRAQGRSQGCTCAHERADDQAVVIPCKGPERSSEDRAGLWNLIIAKACDEHLRNTRISAPRSMASSAIFSALVMFPGVGRDLH